MEKSVPPRNVNAYHDQLSAREDTIEVVPIERRQNKTAATTQNVNTLPRRSKRASKTFQRTPILRIKKPNGRTGILPQDYFAWIDGDRSSHKHAREALKEAAIAYPPGKGCGLCKKNNTYCVLGKTSGVCIACMAQAKGCHPLQWAEKQSIPKSLYRLWLKTTKVSKLGPIMDSGLVTSEEQPQLGGDWDSEDGNDEAEDFEQDDDPVKGLQLINQKRLEHPVKNQGSREKEQAVGFTEMSTEESSDDSNQHSDDDFKLEDHIQEESVEYDDGTEASSKEVALTVRDKNRSLTTKTNLADNVSRLREASKEKQEMSKIQYGVFKASEAQKNKPFSIARQEEIKELQAGKKRLDSNAAKVQIRWRTPITPTTKRNRDLHDIVKTKGLPHPTNENTAMTPKSSSRVVEGNDKQLELDKLKLKVKEAQESLALMTVERDNIGNDVAKAREERDAADVNMANAWRERNYFARECDKLAKKSDKLDQAQAELLENRDRAKAARAKAEAERDQAFIQRREAIAERIRAVIERNEAIAESDQHASAGARLLEERNEAFKQRDATFVQRDQVWNAKDKYILQRQQAIVKRDRALAEKIKIPEMNVRISQDNVQLVHQRDQLLRYRDISTPDPRTTQRTVAGQFQAANKQADEIIMLRGERDMAREQRDKEKAFNDGAAWFKRLTWALQEYNINTAAWWAEELDKRGINMDLLLRQMDIGPVPTLPKSTPGNSNRNIVVIDDDTTEKTRSDETVVNQAALGDWVTEQTTGLGGLLGDFRVIGTAPQSASVDTTSKPAKKLMLEPKKTPVDVVKSESSDEQMKLIAKRKIQLDAMEIDTPIEHRKRMPRLQELLADTTESDTSSEQRAVMPKPKKTSGDATKSGTLTKMRKLAPKPPNQGDTQWKERLHAAEMATQNSGGPMSAPFGVFRVNVDSSQPSSRTSSLATEQSPYPSPYPNPLKRPAEESGEEAEGEDWVAAKSRVGSENNKQMQRPSKRKIVDTTTETEVGEGGKTSDEYTEKAGVIG